MKCPGCNGNLEQKIFKGVSVYECQKCNGKWFDKDELNKAKDSTDETLRWLDFDIFDDKTDKYESSPAKRECPKDQSPMKSLSYMDSKIIIDKCDKCKGVWLDNKEFERIIKYLEKIVLTQPASDYAKDAVKEFEEIFTGPENTISEIKDFLAVMKLFEQRTSAENPWIVKMSNAMDKLWPIR